MSAFQLLSLGSLVVAALLLVGWSGAPRTASELERALIAAARRGDADTASHLLEQGASIHASDENGATALIAAAYENHVAVARLLVAAGADVNVQDRTRQSAFLIATSEGYLDLLVLTLHAGADVHRTDSYNGTGLIRAADRGHVEIIRELLETEINVDHLNRLGWTALLEAIILGDGGPRHSEVVKLLVEAGADVNLADSQGVTPLAHARRRGFTDMAAILEAAGAKLARPPARSVDWAVWSPSLRTWLRPRLRIVPSGATMTDPTGDAPSLRPNSASSGVMSK